jgi:dolichyl-phosphate beta-glucosyltransferase
MNSLNDARPIALSIVIPAYQEAPVIALSLSNLADWLTNHDYGRVEVVVVVADSPDGTAAIVRTEAHRFSDFQLVEPGERVGKGRDVRSGMLAARGQYRLFMDADLATPLHHLDELVAYTKTHGDGIIGVRNLGQIHHQFKRRILSEAGNLLAQVVLLPGLRDTQCGFKMFRADITEAVFHRLTILGWGLDLEILAIARTLSYKIATMPIPDWIDPKETGTGLVNDSTRGVAVQTLRDLLVIRLRLLRRLYH